MKMDYVAVLNTLPYSLMTRLRKWSRIINIICIKDNLVPKYTLINR